MNTKHTPGPWAATHCDGDDLRVVNAEGVYVVAGCGCCGSPFGDNLEHDAPLIAAAPELLEALMFALRDMEATQKQYLMHAPNVGVLSVSIAQARAAIKKATGEA